MLPNFSNLHFDFFDPPPLFRAKDLFSEREILLYYTRLLTNYTFRGFHPISECTVSFDSTLHFPPNPPSRYASDRVHPQHLTSVFLYKLDLTMTYQYDTADEFLLGDDVVILPFVTRVYRLDLELEWFEVYEGLLGNKVPSRYEQRDGEEGPMTERGFRKMLRRFRIHEVRDEPSRMVWYMGSRCVEAYDRGSGKAVFDDWQPSRWRKGVEAGISGRNSKYSPLW